MGRLSLGLALGSGGARGWSHIGVIRALEARNLAPDVVCGASVGSLVGAAYASGQLDILQEWVLKLRRIDVLRLLDATLRGGGVIHGSRIMNAIGNQLEDHDIEALPIRFAAVATDLETGREVWLREGSMLRAVRTSSGMPGLFVPVRDGDRWLVDGGVVNPVPVSLCHALGADLVLAVNLNGDKLSRYRTRPPPPAPEPEPGESDEEEASYFDRVTGLLGGLWPSGKDAERRGEPGMLEVLVSTLNIMQERITRSRMAGEPPHAVVTPRLGELQLMDFHRAAQAIDEGRRAVERMSTELEYLEESLAG